MKFKSKNAQIILFSVIGLVVLGAVVAVLMLTQPKGEGSEEETTVTTVDPALVMNEYTSADVTKIEVTNESGSFVIVPFDNEGTAEWTVEGLEIDHSLLSQSSFTTIVGYVAGMTAKTVVEEDASDLAKYGLESPAASVSVTYSDGTVFGFKVGAEAPTGSANYFAKAGSNTVYTYSSYKLSTLTAATGMTFVTTTVMPSYDTETAPTIKKVTVKRTDLEQPIVLQSLPEAEEGSINVYTHEFTSPVTGYLDLTNGDTFLYGMYGLTAASAAYAMSDENKEKTGLTEPFCEVAMLVEDSIYRLFLGDAIVQDVTDETSGVTSQQIVGYYGYCNQVPDIIYVFSSDTVFWATMGVGDYMSEMFLMPYVYDLSGVSYYDAANDFTVEVTGDNTDNHFYIDGEEINGDDFKSFYQYLISAKGNEFYTDDAKGELIARVTYTYESADIEPDVVEFYSCEDRSVIIAVNGANCYKTKQMYTIRLLENAEALLTGGEIVLTY